MTERLIIDTACPQCGYNLRTLSLEGNCPECGASIRDCLHNRLRDVDPDWVLTVSRGLGLMFAGIISCVVGVFFPAILMITLGVYFVGGWMISTPNPSGLWEKQDGFWRKSARWVLMGGAAVILILSTTLVTTRDPDNDFADNLMLTCWVVGAVACVAVPKYLSKLAMRIPDAKLARTARVAMWGLTSGNLIYAFCLVLVATGIADEPDLPGILAIILLAVFGIVYLVLLVRLYYAVSREGKTARERVGTP